MMETILLHLLIGLIIFAVIFAVIRIAVPNIGLPEWMAQIIYLVLGVIFLIWIIYLLLPLARTAM